MSDADPETRRSARRFPPGGFDGAWVHVRVDDVRLPGA